jgi:hypothetical protein
MAVVIDSMNLLVDKRLEALQNILELLGLIIAVAILVEDYNFSL